jgi:hypothetical protein
MARSKFRTACFNSFSCPVHARKDSSSRISSVGRQIFEAEGEVEALCCFGLVVS